MRDLCRGPVDEECAGMLPRWVDARHPLYFRHPSSTPSPYQLNTIAAAPSDFIAKSEGALELVRRWYGEGTALVGVGTAPIHVAAGCYHTLGARQVPSLFSSAGVSAILYCRTLATFAI